MSKTLPEIALDEAARRRLAAGAAHLSRCVRPALGPRGGSVLIERRYAEPHASRDGVEIARRLECADPVANLGLKVVREAALKTSEEAGDGTTTAMVLAGGILEHGWKALAAGVEPRALRAGLTAAWREADAYLQARARPLEESDSAPLARRAAGEPALGDLVVEACNRVGPDGQVIVEEDPGTGAALEIRPGMTVPTRLLSEEFLTDRVRFRTLFEEAFVLLHEAPLQSLSPLVPLLEKVLDAGRPLVIFAQDIKGEALTSLALNASKGVMRVLPVRAPGYGKRQRGFFEDMACLTGAEFLAAEKGIGLEDCGLEQLGRAARIEAGPETLTLAGGTGSPEALARHVACLGREIEDEASQFDREKLEERRARLCGGIALLRVGGRTEAEGVERRARARNAINALKAARREGLLPGGGAALLQAAEEIEARSDLAAEAGRRCLSRALRMPLATLAANAGFDGSWIAYELSRKPGAGWDVGTGQVGGRLGVEDPAHVVRAALRAAVGAAATLLEAGAVVAHAPHREETVFL